MEHDPSRRGVDPDSAAQGPPFRKRLTRRTKIFIVADLVILVAALTASLVWVATRQDGPSESAASSAATSTTPLLTTKPTPPLQSAQGIAWITAACGNPTLIQGTGPNTLLARSTDLGICMGTPGAPSVLVGVYEHGSGLDDDLVGDGK